MLTRFCIIYVFVLLHVVTNITLDSFISISFFSQKRKAKLVELVVCNNINIKEADLSLTPLLWTVGVFLDISLRCE